MAFLNKLPAAVLFIFSFFIFSCTPLALDEQPAPHNSGGESFGGAGDADGGSSGGLPSSVENEIPGIYTGDGGYSIDFSSNKTGNISGGANPNMRAASGVLPTGSFTWSVTNTTVTLKMDSDGSVLTASYSTGTITINGKTFSKTIAPPMTDDSGLGGSYNDNPSSGGGIPGSYNGSVIDELTHVSRLVIVTSSFFENTDTLKTYIKHKKRQGFDVQVLRYNGGGAENIRSELSRIYYSASYIPMSILIVGDESGNGAVPAFDGKIGSLRHHVTDFYFGEYTGDFVPEAVVGRFSAKNERDLEIQVNKTIFMEEKIAVNESSVTNYIVVSQELRSDQVGYVRDHLRKNRPEFNHTEISLSGNASKITEAFNKGAGFALYTGHGLQSSWNYSWDYGVYHVNEQNHISSNLSYPVLFASTCYTGSYDFGADCLAEAFVKNPNGGAVAYIGASDQSFLGHNDRMLGGNYDVPSQELYPGLFGSLFYTPDIDKKYKVRTVGGVLHAAFRACHLYGLNASGEYQIEIYNLLGDPTYMPYTRAPKELTFRFNGSPAAGRNFVVTTAPEAQVAITRTEGDDIKIIAATFADETGRAVLTIPENVASGEAVLYGIAPNYPGRYQTIQIVGSAVERSSNANLSKIVIKDKATGNVIRTIDVTNTSGTTYSFDVIYEQPILEIVATSSESSARISGAGTTNKLTLGTNTVTITVQAEDGTKKTYTLNITRKATTKSRDNKLKSLTVDGYTLTPSFRPDIIDYKITVPSNVTHVTINAEPNDSRATVTLQNDDVAIPYYDYDGQANGWPIWIFVQPEFEELSALTYTVKVYRERPN